MGLADSHHIARIVIHPKDPDTVYVAAMGHLFAPNAERGVFKTTDGGKSWKKVLYVNDKIGAVDLAIVESAPDTLYAAMYDKVRLPWHYELGGPESAIYKTTDGGQDLDAARRRAADRAHRPDRPRRLSEEPRDPLRRRRERQPPPADGAGGRAGQAPRRRAGPADGRQRGLPHRRRRPDLAQGQRRLRSGPQQGPLFLQPAPPRPERPRDGLHHRAVARLDERRRQDLEGARLAVRRGHAARLRRLAGDVDRPARSEPAHLRLGRRRQHLLRPGQDEPPRLQHPAGGVLRRRRGHGGPVQHLRRPSGPRLVERALERLGRGDLARRLGHGRRGRRHVQLRRPDRLALGLQQPRDGHDVAVRPEDERPDADHAPAPGRRAAPALQLDAADRALAPQFRPSSTPGPRSSSDRSTAATTGRRSAPT